MKTGVEWRCGNCGKIYNTDEFLVLGKVKVVESDTEPWKQHGYTPMCKCGYRFSLDRWRLSDDLKIKINEDEREIIISTVDLELNHGFNEDQWYETMVFVENIDGKDDIESPYERRYTNKEDAIGDHNRILNLLKEGKYTIEEVNNEKILHIIETET